MIPPDQTCTSLLLGAIMVAALGAAFMVVGVYEGYRILAWGGAAVFFGSSLVAAWCFGRLV